MKRFLKIFLLAWLGVVTAFLVSVYLLPASAANMVEYQALQAEIASQAEPTEAQKKRREELFLALNSKDNIKQDVMGYVGKNVLFFLIMVPLCFMVARYSGLDNNAILMVAALFFIPFILVKFFITGAILASSLVLGGIAFRKQAPAPATVESPES